MALAPHLLRTLVAASGVVFAMAGLPRSAGAAEHGQDLPSALVIAKSSNKNQVHYAVQVDEACAPAGREPVSPYWRMLERGPDVTEPLSDGELRVLGVERQEITPGGIQMALRGLPARIFTIRTWRGADGKCTSSLDTTVAGVNARVASVYVKQKLFGVDYVLLTGVSADGSVVHERVVP